MTTPLQNNPQSRFQLIQTAVALPAQCVTCSSPAGPFIDFGFSADFYGVVLFCIPCATDLGNAVGMLNHEAVQHLVDRADKADRLLAIVETTVDVFRKSIDESVSVLGDSLSTLSPSLTSYVEIDGEPETGTEESDSTDSDDNGLIAADSEFIVGERSNGVSSNSSGDDIFSGESGDSKS